MAISSIADLFAQVGQYLIAKGLTLPPVTATALTTYHPSPVDHSVKSCEALWAVAANLDAEGLALCADIADFVTGNQWHVLGQTPRGSQIAAACRRAKTYVAGKADPAPDAQYQIPAPAQAGAALAPA